MTTFEIIEDLKILTDMKLAVNEDTGEYMYSEEAISQTCAMLEAKKEEKLNAIEDYKRSIKKEQELYEDKKKKQESNIKKCKDKVDYLKTLQEALLNGEKLKTDEYTFYYKESESVVVTNADAIEKKYFKIEKKPILKDIKEAYLKAVADGETFFGATLEKKSSLSIR